MDIYGDSVTFDEFCKSISGNFHNNIVKGSINNRILIPKNYIKTPSKSTEAKIKKKKAKGAESCRIEKYLKNVEKFTYPGSSLSTHMPDGVQFATIDSKRLSTSK